MFETKKSRIRRILREEIRNGTDLTGISEKIRQLEKRVDKLNRSEMSGNSGGVFVDALKSVQQNVDLRELGEESGNLLGITI